jgi:hypothetical protein
VQTIDCRRAQFSAQEPIVRLRVICQSWKVMFQAEYSSGQPLRMLVDLRASVEQALGRGKAPEAEPKAGPAAKAAPAVKPAPKPAAVTGVAAKPAASAAAAGASKAPAKAVAPAAAAKPKPKPAAEELEFEVSGEPGWEEDSASPKKK